MIGTDGVEEDEVMVVMRRAMNIIWARGLQILNMDHKRNKRLNYPKDTDDNHSTVSFYTETASCVTFVT